MLTLGRLKSRRATDVRWMEMMEGCRRWSSPKTGPGTWSASDSKQCSDLGKRR